MMDPFHSPLALYHAQIDALGFPSVEKLDEVLCQQIAAEVSGASSEQLHLLNELLAGSIWLYKSWNGFEEKHSPKGILRRKLKAFVKAVEYLQGTMLDLDWGTRRTLAPFADGKEVPSLRQLSARKPEELVLLDHALWHSHDLLTAISNAIRRYLLLTTAGQGGPRARNAREAFGVDIADVISQCAPEWVEVNSTSGGKFENIVAICLQAAGQSGPGDLRRIVLAAVKGYQADYRPRGLKVPPKSSDLAGG